MNDMLHLKQTPNKFQKNSNFNFEHEKTTDEKTGEIKWEKEYFNHEKFNCDINEYGMLVHINPNKLNNLIWTSEPLSFRTVSDTIAEIEELLHEFGIDTSLKLAKIIRYDNSFDLQISKMYAEYEAIINTILPTIMTIRYAKTSQYENTKYIGNKSTTIASYNKTAEADLIENVLRLEARRKIAHLKLHFNELNEKTFNELRAKDKSLIENSFFGKNPEVFKNELIETVYEVLHKSDMNFSKTAEIIMMAVLKHCDYEGIMKVNEELKTSRTNSVKYRRDDKIKKALNSNLRLQDFTQFMNYEELKTLLKDLR